MCSVRADDSLCGCPLAIVGGIAAAGGAGYAANQERGVGGTANDFSIKTNIQTALAKANPDMAASLNVTVYEGRALLTGTAPNPEIKAQAGDIARGIPGVRAVYDEIEVAPGESVWNSTKDAWITSRCARTWCSATFARSTTTSRPSTVRST